MKTQMIATLAGGLLLTVLQSATGMAFGPIPGPDAPPDVLGWLLLSNVLVAGVLAWLARMSVWTGPSLAAALFAVSYGIGTFNSLVEAYVFDFFHRPGELQALFVLTLVPAVLFAPMMVWLAGRWRRPRTVAARPPEHSAAVWAARFAACSVAYLLLYFAAGMIIYPYVRQFYEGTKTLPSTLTIVALQLLLRGPIFVALGLLIVRFAPASRHQHALMVGVVMSVLAGVAPLLVPNAYFPDAVRWVHLIETTTSNFAFGAIVGWLLGGEKHLDAGVVSHAA
jgi:hypothetical protein